MTKTNLQAMDLKSEIIRLKTARKAAILAHNYQIEDIQAIADYVGDSLELSRLATTIESEIIVFCGVHFMAESAAILNPQKKVLLPDLTAGCPMAEMITAESLRQLKAKYPQAAVVCYVNSSAEVKAESDICCTSSNAVKVVNSLPEKQIIFVPDKHLGRYASSFTDKEIILWEGFCPTHARLSREAVLKMKAAHPQADFIAHPECSAEVLALADYVCSTSGMFKYAHDTNVEEIIIGTEKGMLYRLGKNNPGKKFYLASEQLICPNMKKNNLEKVYNALAKDQYVVHVPEEIRQKAYQSILRMLDVS
ncbi:MAG: quinolinate synthase NadA [Elusimicrobiota bacterium]